MNSSKYVTKKIRDLPISQIRIFFEKARQIKDAVRLEIGEPDFHTPKHIKDAAKKALDEGFTHYTSFNGIGELREAISEKLRRENGIEADPESEITVTPGACSALYCGVLSVVGRGEKVLVPDPGWPHYVPCTKIAGGIPQFYPLLEENFFEPNPNDLVDRIDNSTKALIINSPNNPTGAVFRKKTLEEIAKIAQENDLVVLSDEVYEKIIYDDHKHTSIASLPNMRERTITLNALSKTYAMTGWRIGYATAPAEIINQMTKLVLYTSTCANSIGQKASIAALQGPQDCVKAMVKEYKRRRDFLIDRLNEIDGISCRPPKGAFYAFPSIKDLKMSSFDCACFLLEKAKVATVPGTGFGRYGEGYLRMSYSTSTETIGKAMNRIKSAVDEHPVQV